MEITEIAGYRVRARLGAGGMGQVFLVEHPRLPRRDALKLLDEGVSRNDDFKVRFQREADLLARLSHPNIVTLHDRGEHEGRLWITMEYVEGTDAGQLVESSGALSPHLALQLIAGAGSALDYAWRKQRITHRDVKPANILVAMDGPDAHPDAPVEAVKLADFGIAKAAEESTSLTSTGITVGTLAYISPEAIEGQAVDNRSDIYSLGCTAFHLLTGQAPYSGGTMTALMSAHLHQEPPRISALRPELPATLDSVFACVLAKDPNRRYQTCSDFVAALSAALDGVAVDPVSARTVVEPHRSDRRLWLSLLAAACILAAIAVAGGVVYLSGKSDTTTPVAATTRTPAPTTTTITRTTSPPSTPTVVEETTPTEDPVTETTPTTAAPYEGQPCGPEQFNEHSPDGTLYCSALEGAWTDLTHQTRSAVQPGSSCDEPGARAQIYATEAIGVCRAGPDGTLTWQFPQ